jgi:hypothetical protein
MPPNPVDAREGWRMPDELFVWQVRLNERPWRPSIAALRRIARALEIRVSELAENI